MREPFFYMSLLHNSSAVNLGRWTMLGDRSLSKIRSLRKIIQTLNKYVGFWQKIAQRKRAFRLEHP